MIKILVADDESDLRQQLTRIAREDGREVMEAESLEQAKQLIAQNDFDIVVTDIGFDGGPPNKDGIEILKACKEKDPYTQVIVVTSYGEPELSIETMRFGAYDYLERGSPGLSFYDMLRSKIKLALEFREARMMMRSRTS